MRLKERASWPSSSLGGPSSTRDRQVAAAHLLGRRHQPADRLGQAGREQDRRATPRPAASGGRWRRRPANMMIWPRSTPGLDLGVELAGKLDALDVVDDPEIDRVTGRPRSSGSPTNSCMTKYGAASAIRAGSAPPGRRALPEALLAGHRIGVELGVGRDGAGDSPCRRGTTIASIIARAVDLRPDLVERPARLEQSTPLLRCRASAMARCRRRISLSRARRHRLGRSARASTAVRTPGEPASTTKSVKLDEQQRHDDRHDQRRQDRERRRTAAPAACAGASRRRRAGDRARSAVMRPASSAHQRHGDAPGRRPAAPVIQPRCAEVRPAPGRRARHRSRRPRRRRARQATPRRCGRSGREPSCSSCRPSVERPARSVTWVTRLGETCGVR